MQGRRDAARQRLDALLGREPRTRRPWCCRPSCSPPTASTTTRWAGCRPLSPPTRDSQKPSSRWAAPMSAATTAIRRCGPSTRRCDSIRARGRRPGGALAPRALGRSARQLRPVRRAGAQERAEQPRRPTGARSWAIAGRNIRRAEGELQALTSNTPITPRCKPRPASSRPLKGDHAPPTGCSPMRSSSIRTISKR